MSEVNNEVVDEVNQKHKRGRKIKYNSEEERMQARRKQQREYRSRKKDEMDKLKDEIEKLKKKIELLEKEHATHD